MSLIAQRLRPVLNPRAVAVVGASADPGKFGGRVMRFLVQHGYAGRIIPVNPGSAAVLDLPAYGSVAEARVPVDVALLAVPRQHLPAALEDCGKAGVPCCIVITADFAELGAEGAAREADLVRIAARYGMRLVGPNCLGFINPNQKLALTSSVALANEMPAGAIGLASQSGSMMASMISHAADVGAGFSAAITVGNQADLELSDFVEYFLHDDATRAICLYVEGLKNGPRFLELAERCRAAGKPLLALKAGKSDAAADVTRSHTASLAGSHAVWEAACREHGVIAVDDPESMIDCAHFLVRFGAARSPGVAVASPSGGTIAVTADRVAAAGLELAQLSADTRTLLSRIVPPSRPLNPLDVGGLPREAGVSAAEDAQALLAADPNVGVVFIVVATTPQLDEKVRRWGSAALEAGKPTAILFTPGRLVDGARAALREIGCPYTDRMDDALRVIRASIEYGRMSATTRDEPCAPDYASAIAERAAMLPSGQLTESEAKSLLLSAGIRTVRELHASTSEGAAKAAERIGYPVVMKASSRDIVHKSDAGAVKVGLTTPAAVAAAWGEIMENVKRAAPGASVEGCVIQEMAIGGVETIIGAKWDPQFGAVVMAGAGGIYVELLDDVVFALAPLTLEQAQAMLNTRKIASVLHGARGKRACDFDALADALVRLSWLARTLGPRLVELDVNPLLVRADGVVALDARATLSNDQ